MRKLNLAVGAVLTIMVASIWIPTMLLRGANAATTEYKIAVVDLDAVARDYDYRKEQMEKYRTEFKERSDEIDAEYRILLERREALRDPTASMTEEERFELELVIEDDFHVVQQKLSGLDADRARAQKRLELKISFDIESTLKTIAFEENYHLVLDSRDGKGVVYASTTINMTTKLIDRLNEMHSSQN